jgi:hypothetical protein
MTDQLIISHMYQLFFRLQPRCASVSFPKTDQLFASAAAAWADNVRVACKDDSPSS